MSEKKEQYVIKEITWEMRQAISNWASTGLPFTAAFEACKIAIDEIEGVKLTTKNATDILEQYDNETIYALSNIIADKMLCDKKKLSFGH